ncbi:ABC transporter ATP-binding protein [Solimonas soli]|uniref:ABC transporter ATP-binding protein n=1 Tax=Solimonas soli TaxID=413479 RepID=UPI000480BC95|nr:ABC transporter ATP-binding protein [Solimonas soli]
MIRARGLLKRYRGAASAALHGIDFDVAAGSVFGLLGPNGAGKTTLMSLLTGVLRPDGGALTVAGCELPAQADALRPQLGFAPQELAFYPALSVAENLRLFMQLTPGADAASLAQAIEVADLGAQLRKPAQALSGGLRRRLNFAIALLGRPRLLLLDEPTAGVDPQSRNFLLERVRALRDEGVTVLYSTHYFEEIERICDRALVLDRGRVVAGGTLAELRGTHARLEDAFLQLTDRALRDA